MLSALRRVSAKMSFPQTSTVAYSIALMCFDAADADDPVLRDTHEAVLQVARSSGRYRDLLGLVDPVNSDGSSGKDDKLLMELSQLRIFAHYLSVCPLAAEAKAQVPPEMLESVFTRDGELFVGTTQQSWLQMRVTKELKEAMQRMAERKDEYEILVEYSSFAGLLPLDAAVLRKGRLVAMLEVDGPYQFRFDNKIRRMDLLKEHMYRSKHPGAIFHRINFNDEKKLGAAVLSRELAALIDEVAEQNDDMLGGFFRKIKQSWDNFLGWSLRNSKSS